MGGGSDGRRSCRHRSTSTCTSASLGMLSVVVAIAVAAVLLPVLVFIRARDTSNSVLGLRVLGFSSFDTVLTMWASDFVVW